MSHLRTARGAIVPLSLVAALCASTALTPSARAQTQPSSAQVNEARALFQSGMRLVEQERWGEALEFFRRSRAIAARPSTVFNIGSVLVRLGRMAEAIATLEEFLRVSDERQNAAERAEAQRLLTEARAARASLALSTNVEDAHVFIDGSPLEGRGADRSLQLDPGTHVLRLTAEGHEEQSVSISLLPGQTTARAVVLRPLPTRISLAVTPAQARVSLDGVDRGDVRSFDVQPGRHELSLRAEGFLPLDRAVDVRLGQALSLDLSLSRRPATPITQSPWFWTAIGAGAVATIAVVLVVAVPVQLEPYGGNTNTVISALRDR
ncbi:MAG: PEGA domain-containing protein [Polyangiales bacterium]